MGWDFAVGFRGRHDCGAVQCAEGCRDDSCCTDAGEAEGTCESRSEHSVVSIVKRAEGKGRGLFISLTCGEVDRRKGASCKGPDVYERN